MRQHESRQDRPGRWTRNLVATACLLAWGLYKASNTRVTPSAMQADDSCCTDPSTVADLRHFTAGAAPIHCRPWDIGTGVTGYVWHAPSPRAVLLLQHGYAEYAQRFVKQYNRLIPHLLNAGVSVYAFDLWGHGRSPGRPAVTNVAQAVEDHLAARRKLQEQPLPVLVLGHSLGGLVTATSVLRAPGGLRGAILTSSLLHYDATRWVRFFATVGAVFAPTLPAPIKTAEISRLYHGAREEELYANTPLFYRKKMPMLLAATAGRIAHNNWKRYPKWQTPVLVMHGTADESTDPQGSRRFFATIPAQDKTLHLVEDGYHELLNDTDQDATLETLLTWIERRLSK